MTKWVWKGVRTGIKTTVYPDGEETAPGISPGRPVLTECGSREEALARAGLCPIGALREDGNRVQVDPRSCVHCLRCRGSEGAGIDWEGGFEWARWTKRGTPFDRAFARSLHIRVVDAGACGACMSEINQLNNPYYNIHRLGFFITPTPRNADLLMIAGPLTEHMVDPLLKTYEAMPGPKRVIAVGTCALTGGPFGKGFACRGGIGEVLPVDLEIPGCPPPPLALVHALLMISGREGRDTSKGGR